MKTAVAITVGFLLALMAFPQSARAEIKISHERTFNIPGVTPNADLIRYEMTFADLDLDGYQEALVLCRGQSVHLYDFEQDSVVWSYRPAIPVFPTAIATGDVNGDSIPDILVAENNARSIGMPSYDSLYSRLLVFDGASDWTQSHEVIHGYYEDHPLFYREIVRVFRVDYDQDSRIETIFSFDTSTCLANSYCYTGSLLGASEIYSTPLGNPVTTLTDRFTELRPIRLANGMTGTIGVRRRFEMNGPADYSRSHLDVVSLLPDGSIYPIFVNDYPVPDTADYSGFCQASQYLRLLCVGDIDTTLLGEEALVHINPAYYCDRNSPDTSQSKDYRIQLWRLLEADQPELVWEVVDSGFSAGYHMDNAGVNSQFPGSFFSIYDGRVFQFDGHSGLPIDSSSDPFGCSIVSWEKSFAGGDSRLVCGSGTEGRFDTYQIDTPTDVADWQTDGNLPGALQLSQPYPNPFNPSVSFSIALPQRADVTIEVVNVMSKGGRCIQRPSAGR